MAEEPRTDDEGPDIVRMAHRYYRQCKDHSSEWREEANTNYDMAAGKQWDDDDLAKLQGDNRPAVTFNRIARTLNAICGTQVANRQETRFVPREMGDTQINEILSAAAEWVRDGCQAEDEESDAFEDMCITGMGCTETRLDYESDPEGAIVIERRDIKEMYWDPAATKRNLSDAKWCMRIKSYDRAEFIREWPEANDMPTSDPWDARGEDESTGVREHVYPQDAYNNQKAGAQKGKAKIRVAQLQWAEMAMVYRVGSDAQILSAGAFKKIKKRLDAERVPYIKQPTAKWRQAFIAGSEILDEGECPFPDGPTFRFMTYKRDRNKNVWYGLVRAMTDPQKFGNKFFSQILDILNKGAKGGVMLESDAVADIRKFEEKWARPDGVVELRPGALAGGKIQPKPLVSLPPGLDKLMQFSMDGVHDVTGINLELLGMANREQSGILEHQRKQAGVTIIAPLFDGLRRYRKEQGRVLLHFIQTFISDGRLIRIAGNDGNQQYVPLIKQPEIAKYDIIVDEAPTSPNMKERVFGVMSDLLPTIAKMGLPVPPEVLDYSPLPSALVSKWKELIVSHAGANPQQMQEQMGQMQQQMQKMAQENAGLKNKSAQTAAQMQLDSQKQQHDMAMAQQKMQLERVTANAQMELEHTKAVAAIELERQRAVSELELEQMKLGGQLDLQRMQNDANTNLAREEMQAGMQIKSTANDNSAIEEALKNANEVAYHYPEGRVVKFQKGRDGKSTTAHVDVSKVKKLFEVQRGADGSITGATDGTRNITVHRNASGEMTGAEVA